MNIQNFKPLALSMIALGGAFAAGAANATVISLDVNADGANDLRFTYSVTSPTFMLTQFAYSAEGLSGTKVSIGGPLALGNLIGADTGFAETNLLAGYARDDWYCFFGCGSKGISDKSYHFGSWNNGYNDVSGYLGFALASGDDTFYGWANIAMNHSGAAVILGTGIESCADTAIGAGAAAAGCTVTPPTDVPEPASLALLAAGFAGMGAMRRRRAAVKR